MNDNQNKEIRFYLRDNKLVLLLHKPEGDRFRYLNNSGTWKNGKGMFEKYFYNGEPGYEEIERDEAEVEAKRFGSTLDEGLKSIAIHDDSVFDPEDHYDEPEDEEEETAKA